MGRKWIVVLSIIAGVISATTLAASPESREAVWRFGRRVGLIDPLPPPVEVIDLIVDVSEGSPASPESFRAQIDAVLERIGRAPNSALRIIVQGAKALDAVIVATVQSGRSKQPHARAADAYAKQFAATKADFLAKAMEPFFEHRPKLRSSPIVETINWTTMLSPPPSVPPDTPRRIICISDAREVSPEFGDFECGALPTPPEFLKSLRTHDVLAPGSLEHTRLHFAFDEPRLAPRRKCPPMNTVRIKRIRELWQIAAQNAGALETTFNSGALTLPTDDKEVMP